MSLEERLDGLKQKTFDSVKTDFHQTVGAYKNLTFSPDQDPTLVAANDSEKDMILDAARLLGYQVTKSDGKVSLVPPSQDETRGDLEQVIENRIKIGIANLISDYEGMIRMVRRPVRRMVVAMAITMADSLRNSG